MFVCCHVWDITVKFGVLGMVRPLAQTKSQQRWVPLFYLQYNLLSEANLENLVIPRYSTKSGSFISTACKSPTQFFQNHYLLFFIWRVWYSSTLSFRMPFPEYFVWILYWCQRLCSWTPLQHLGQPTTSTFYKLEALLWSPLLWPNQAIATSWRSVLTFPHFTTYLGHWRTC